MLTPVQIRSRLESLLAQESFDGIAGDLFELLSDSWIRSADMAINAVVEFISTLNGSFTQQNLDEATEIMGGFMGPRFGERVSPVVREAVTLSYSLSQEDIRTGLSTSFNLIDRRTLGWLHEHDMYWTRTWFDREWTERIANLSEVAIKNGMSRRDAGIFFRNTLGSQLVDETDQYWELVADAITTRSRSFGAIEAMVKADIQEYRVDAVIDHRTSDICRYLDGQPVDIVNDEGITETVQLSDNERVFQVEHAVNLRDQMIAAQTPEEAKDIMGWKSPKAVVGKFPVELARMGVVTPPFHARCRSRLVIV